MKNTILILAFLSIIACSKNNDPVPQNTVPTTKPRIDPIYWSDTTSYMIMNGDTSLMVSSKGKDTLWTFFKVKNQVYTKINDISLKLDYAWSDDGRSLIFIPKQKTAGIGDYSLFNLTYNNKKYTINKTLVIEQKYHGDYCRIFYTDNIILTETQNVSYDYVNQNYLIAPHDTTNDLKAYFKLVFKSNKFDRI